MIVCLKTAAWGECMGTLLLRFRGTLLSFCQLSCFVVFRASGAGGGVGYNLAHIRDSVARLEWLREIDVRYARHAVFAVGGV